MSPDTHFRALGAMSSAGPGEDDFVSILPRSTTLRLLHSRNWHWEQGTKYAIEGVKALLAINGGAAVAVLAFAAQIGKNGGASIGASLGDALFGFGVGALLAAIGFVTA
jgi:hypothetical protein